MCDISFSRIGKLKPRNLGGFPGNLGMLILSLIVDRNAYFAMDTELFTRKKLTEKYKNKRISIM